MHRGATSLRAMRSDASPASDDRKEVDVPVVRIGFNV